jgi:hypothetical protein
MKPTARSLEFCLLLGSGLLAVAICGLMLTIGITVEPDGWAYWEGSVSILKGHGYRYFGGQAIVDFPPFYSLFLSLVQSIGGVSGWSLAGSLMTLAGSAALAWSCLLASLTRTAPSPLVPRVLGSLYFAAFVGAYYTALLSETLFLVLLPLLFLSLTQIRADDSNRRLTLWMGLCCLLTTALLLTRNSAIAFVPGLALCVFLRTQRFSPTGRIALAALAGALPVSLCGFSRALLGQTGSHPFGLGNRYSPAQYAQQFIEDLAYRMGPSFFFLGGVLLALTVLLIGAAIVRHGASSAHRNALQILLVSATAVLVLFALFNVIPMLMDTFSGRFIWYLPLTLVTALATVTAGETRPGIRHAMTAVLAAVLAIQAERAGAHISLRLSHTLEANVQGHDTISPEHYDKPAAAAGSLILISPPDYPWIYRASADRDSKGGG